jgi:hypothetical protein
MITTEKEKALHDRLLEAISKEIHAFQKDLEKYNETTCTILKEICCFIGCEEHEVSEKVKWIYRQYSIVVIDRDKLKANLTKTKHYPELVQILRDRAIEKGDRETVILIDNFLISGQVT